MEEMRGLVNQDSEHSRSRLNVRLGGVLDRDSERIRSSGTFEAGGQVRRAKPVAAVTVMAAFLLSTMFVVSISPSLDVPGRTVPVGPMGIIGDVSWTNMSPSISPDPRYLGAMVYDPPTDAFVLMGGVDTDYRIFSDTWSYDLGANSWQNRSPADPPYGITGFAYAYDPVDEVTLLSGAGLGMMNETWSYDVSANLWTNLQPSNAPPARIYSGAAYDTQSDKLIMFGGLDLYTFNSTNETWSYDFISNTWTNLTNAYSPPPVCLHTMVYDSESDRIIMFGGITFATLDQQDTFNGTWSYDLDSNTWANMTPLLSPSERYGMSAVYDPVSDRVLTFGGVGIETDPVPTEVLYDDMWEYDYNANSWSEVNQLTRPPARVFAHMAIDPLTRVIVLFGGGGHGELGELMTHGDTWSVQLGTPIPEFQTVILPAAGVIVTVTALAGLMKRTRYQRRD
jgi:N-acetylneuraminic acid mutarotase